MAPSNNCFYHARSLTLCFEIPQLRAPPKKQNKKKLSLSLDCVCVFVRACVRLCVCVVYEDTNLYNDMGMT